eukprot:3574334-Alexandrium_andersonii.AAC.1
MEFNVARRDGVHIGDEAMQEPRKDCLNWLGNLRRGKCYSSASNSFLRDALRGPTDDMPLQACTSGDVRR